ncbi:MAG: hypothetical protein AUG44_15325 [Actinobacteria bacterium 13_1_20CM_3_71_11]|nr:MAG: hypothetical protein AUG44_15325 [Actinobacteria bacterium 13_1_20CM_3_71_11]
MTAAPMSSIGTASPHVHAETRTGPRVGSSGAASTENSTSPASAPSAQANAAGLPCTPPSTSATPSTTTAAAPTSRAVGRCRASSGPRMASASGVLPTTVPNSGGVPDRSAPSTQMLNPTRPVEASAASRSSARRSGRGPGRTSAASTTAARA